MKDIKNILIAGGGMMGKNIAFVFASNPNYQIAVYDLYETDVPGGIRTNTKQLVDSNSQFVERAVRVIKEYGREPATPDEARQILSLKA